MAAYGLVAGRFAAGPAAADFSRISLASGFSNCCWIARLSGRVVFLQDVQQLAVLVLALLLDVVEAGQLPAVRDVQPVGTRPRQLHEFVGCRHSPSELPWPRSYTGVRSALDARYVGFRSVRRSAWYTREGSA